MRFGRSASLESLFELRTDATNIASALKLAQASFPEDSAKRIVVVTDGNENLGDARLVARSLADAGIGIDVVPIVLNSQAEVAVEKIALPPDIRRGQPHGSARRDRELHEAQQRQSNRRSQRATTGDAALWQSR